MCGIFGAYSRSSSVEREPIERALKALHHRGPDGHGHWIHPDKNVGLGHTRLSIIDLSTGQQPIANEDNSIQIVVNGEFYDFERIRIELISKGHKFRTGSDSEIAIHLYEEYGTNCLEYLRGEFAFVLWDNNHKTMFIVRDRFGIKPLFYSVHKDTLFIGSEVKALLAAGVPAEWDEEYIYQSTAALMMNRTLFKNIHQVPPGHFLLAGQNSFQTVCYWDLNFPEETSLTKNFDEIEYVEKFRTLFEECVRLRLRADVPIGVYLSGGLDSCSVLGFASQLANTRLKAFNLSFIDDAQYDEEKIAREMAEKAEAEYISVPVSQSELADNFADYIWHTETPPPNSHGVAKFILSKHVRQSGYKVVLTGEGADEILLGYPNFRQDKILREGLMQGQKSKGSIMDLQKKNMVSVGLMLPTGDAISTEKIQKVLGYVPTHMAATATIAKKVREVYSNEFLNRFEKYDPFHIFLSQFPIERSLRNWDILDQSAYFYLKSITLNFVLNYLGDRSEMAHSIEGRVPFFDHHLVEFVSQLPTDLKLHGMTEKYILREAAKPLIIDKVYTRQKHPFLAPPASLDPKGRLIHLLQDTIRSRSLSSIPFLDQKKVINLVDRIFATGPNEANRTEFIAYDPILMVILGFCLMQNRFNMDQA